MKILKYLIPIVILFAVPSTQSCTKEEVDAVLNSVAPSNEEIISGLKSALNVGTDTSVAKTSKIDGYFKNLAIKILLPKEAEKAISVLKVIPGASGYIDNVILTMNRAAEKAAVEAKPIFVDAITSITISDGKNILFGDSLAATTYLSSKTRISLFNLYKPKVTTALNSVGASDAWDLMTSTYNSIPFVTPIEVNLETYVTDKALDGLFYTVGKEEKDIRKDPAARVNDILKKVFGELDK